MDLVAVVQVEDMGDWLDLASPTMPLLHETSTTMAQTEAHKSLTADNNDLQPGKETGPTMNRKAEIPEMLVTLELPCPRPHLLLRSRP